MQFKQSDHKARRALAGRLLLAVLMITPATASSRLARIKDISRIAGLENIELIGYGVIMGLNGTGDKDLMITKQTVANLMENFNISISMNDIKSKNVAAVSVVATLMPFHEPGDQVDVKVSSIGDATSLEGGVLLMTPMMDPNGEMYAFAQGSITLGGYSAGGSGPGGMSVTRNHTTTGLIPNGAILRVGQTPKFHDNGTMRIILRHPDFTTADRMAAAINQQFGGIAVAQNAGAVVVQMPEEMVNIGRTATFISKVESILVSPDSKARVIVNERTGTIVMGGNVSISETVVAHGNLTVTIKETLHPSHPTRFFQSLEDATSDVRSLETPDMITTVEEESASVMVLPQTSTVQDLANTLNLLGATPRDLISILEALHRLGAIQMELVAM